MRITISRDGGLTWDRTSSREAWIPHGTEHDSYDRLVISALPPVHVGDKDWFYTEVLDGDHRAYGTTSNRPSTITTDILCIKPLCTCRSGIGT